MKKTLLILACVLLLLAGCRRKADPIDKAISVEREKVTALPSTAPTESIPQETEPYISPIDFETLQNRNPDICAWLDIPDTDISYPILLHPTNNQFYLNHAENKGSSAAGSIFMEDYNHADCKDPALAVYGHHMRNGIYFGNLQNIYETAEGFAKHRDIYVYCPDRQIHFRVFAAVPYSAVHLLYTYHFDVSYEYDNFIERVLAVRSFTAQFDPDEVPEFGDQLLILSTCLKADNRQRYLVIGRAKED